MRQKQANSKIYTLFAVLVFVTVFYLPSFGQSFLENAGPVQLRVLTFNIYHGATMKGDFDLDLIASVIKKLDPDLVALQEVDFKTARAKKLDLVTELGYRTGMSPLFGKAMNYDGGEYGEGILSKYSFKSTRVHPLHYSEGHEPRAALEVEVELGNGTVISFIGTHLDHVKDPGDRIMQAKQINELLEKIENPAILAGDLNALPGSDPIQILSRKWALSDAEGLKPTFPSSEPVRKIDYIMFAPAKLWKVIETRVIDERVASDHSPYFVVLELLPGE